MPKESTPGKGRAHRGHLTIFGLAILTTIGGFPVAYQFVEPAPPRKIVIATGDKSGAYYAFAQRYKKVLARDCITLEIRSTAGSGENLKLLTERENGVDIALVQGGDVQGGKSQSAQEIRACLAELDKIENEVLPVSVPQSYAGELYNLWVHISLVGKSLRKRETAFRAGKE